MSRHPLVPTVVVALLLPITVHAADPIKAEVVEQTDKTLLLTIVGEKKPRKGDAVEVYVELPNNLGTAVIAHATVDSVTASFVFSTLQRSTAKLQRGQKARITPPKASAPKAPATTEPKPEPVPQPMPEPDSENSVTAATPNPAASKPAPKTSSAGKPFAESAADSVPSPTANPKTYDGFAEVVRAYKRAVCLAENPDTKAFGTAFVISKKHRILVTNAHVADFATQVVLNESRTVYKIVGRAYHPDVFRVMSADNRTLIRTSNARYGLVSTGCADLALLRLEKIGPDLPSEVLLATPEEARSLQGAEIGMFGYPGYDSSSHPGNYASATFVEGFVSRLTAYAMFQNNAAAPPEHRRLAAFTAPNYPGFSGAPVFLSNGKVIIVNAYVRNLKDGSKMAYGPRVDALWDLIQHAKVLDQIPEAPKAADLGKPWFLEQYDNQAAKTLLTAVDHVAKAAQLRKQQKFDPAMEELNKAEKMAPHYWRTYWEKAKVFDDYDDAHGERSSRKQRETFFKATLNSLITANQKYYESFKIQLVDIGLDLARQHVTMARFMDEPGHMEAALKVLNNQSLQKNLGKKVAYYYALRGSVKKDLGQLAGAVEDLSLAIKSSPRNASYYRERADIHRKRGDARLAAADERVAQQYE